MRGLTIVEVEYVAHQLARELMTWNEPIPEFGTRYPHILESCLGVPFQRFSGHVAYEGLVGKASILFYLMVKNHPFQNGNKRIAVTSLFVFLHLNKKWLLVDSGQLYNFAVWVAQSPSEVRDDVLSAIRTFIKKNMIQVDDLKDPLVIG